MAKITPKIISLILRTLLALIVSTPFIILLLAIQTGPTISYSSPLRPSELSQIEGLILENAPISPSIASRQQLRLNPHELNLLLRYSGDVMNLSPNWAAHMQLYEQSLRSQVSVKISDSIQPLYFNITAELRTESNVLKLTSLSFGKLQIPQQLLNFTLMRVRSRLQSSIPPFPDLSELMTSVGNVSITPEWLDVDLLWDPILLSRLGNGAQRFFISDQDQQRIIHYYQIIAEVVDTIPADIRAVSLNTFLIPLFTSAQERSRISGNPIAENRAIFQTLATYMNEEGIEQLLRDAVANTIGEAKFIEIRLQRRQDLAQHLVSIAAITASAGADFAELLSTTKEAYDARYRSGFSFSDLTANSVGVTLSRRATQDPASAIRMQERIISIQNEADYMPEVGNNRDGLSESDFNALYQDRNSTQYQERLSEIQKLINERPLFAGF